MSKSSRFDALMAVNKRPPITMVEGRGSWLVDENGKRYLDFGQGWAVNSLARKGFRPYFVLTGGAAEAAASLNAFVYDGTAPPINGQQQTTQYSAWKHVGQGFIGGGLGTAFAFSPTFGITAELRVMEYFPTTGTGLGIQIGPMLGF